MGSPHKSVVGERQVGFVMVQTNGIKPGSNPQLRDPLNDGSPTAVEDPTAGTTSETQPTSNASSRRGSSSMAGRGISSRTGRRPTRVYRPVHRSADPLASRERSDDQTQNGTQSGQSENGTAGQSENGTAAGDTSNGTTNGTQTQSTSTSGSV